MRTIGMDGLRPISPCSVLRVDGGNALFPLSPCLMGCATRIYVAGYLMNMNPKTSRLYILGIFVDQRHGFHNMGRQLVDNEDNPPDLEYVSSRLPK